MTDEEDLCRAITEFRQALPGWWFTVGDCSVSADASCGPDFQREDKALLKISLFDEGFHVDLPQPASMADALRIVVKAGLEAKAATVKEIAA